jgi:hypothetical protein
VLLIVMVAVALLLALIMTLLLRPAESFSSGIGSSLNQACIRK